MPPRGQRALPVLQVLQAIAVQLARTAWTQALPLMMVCRCAPRADREPRQLAGAAPGEHCARRRLKEALERPYWSTVDEAHAARLWRALGRPGAPHPLQL